jgi:membrane glycosyltransferase
LRADIRAFRDTLLARALRDGTANLSSFERRVLLSDPHCVDEIHRRAWSLPPAQADHWLGDSHG